MRSNVPQKSLRDREARLVQQEQASAEDVHMLEERGSAWTAREKESRRVRKLSQILPSSCSIHAIYLAQQRDFAIQLDRVWSTHQGFFVGDCVQACSTLPLSDLTLPALLRLSQLREIFLHGGKGCLCSTTFPAAGLSIVPLLGSAMTFDAILLRATTCGLSPWPVPCRCVSVDVLSEYLGAVMTSTTHLGRPAAHMQI